MLILMRKEGQRIFIGKEITLTVKKINGKQVSLGIDAPEDVQVLREELCIDTLKKPLKKEVYND
jgi:carbon storage regulator